MEVITTITKELNTIKDLVSHILECYPHTRNSDTDLYLQCCEYFGAYTVEKQKKLNLNVISIHKIRQVIQNKEGKFLADEKVRKARKHRAKDIREYMSRLN